jgi:hypothetical protein
LTDSIEVSVFSFRNSLIQVLKECLGKLYPFPLGISYSQRLRSVIVLFSHSVDTQS